MARSVSAEKAVAEMQFYLGSVDYNTVRDQQKLYARVIKSINALATKTGMLPTNVWKAVELEARRRGIVRPIPGRHV